MLVGAPDVEGEDGEAAGSTRSAVTSAPGGSADRASASRASTSGCAAAMSVSGAKKSDSSAAPRMVRLRTRSRPGTPPAPPRAAASSRPAPSPPARPASGATTCSRGKVTSG